MKALERRRIRATAFLVFLAFFLAGPLTADSGSGEKSVREGFGYVMPGMSFLDYSGLNSSLAGRRIGPFGRPSSGLGAGGHVIVGKLVLGLEGHAVFKKSRDSTAGPLSLSGGLGFFDIGALLHADSKRRFYALFGIGAGSIRLALQGTSAGTFAGIIAEPTERIKLTSSGFLLNLSLGADRIMKFGGKARVMLGIRGGFVLAPGHPGWELGYEEIVGGPKTALTGPFIRLVVGCGFIGR